MTLYVLTEGSWLRRLVPPGSAIVGTAAPDGRTVRVDCEPARRSALPPTLSGLLRFSTYAGRVRAAAAHHRSPYPTQARAWLAAEECVPVGAWNEAEGRVVVTDAPRLAAWLGAAALSVRDLSA